METGPRCFQCQDPVPLPVTYQDRARHPYCSTCFNHSIILKSRKRFFEVAGPVLPSSPDEELVIYHDGSLPSLALIRILGQIQEEFVVSQKNLTFPYSFTVIRIPGLERKSSSSTDDETEELLSCWVESKTGWQYSVLAPDPASPFSAETISSLTSSVKSRSGQEDLTNVLKFRWLESFPQDKLGKDGKKVKVFVAQDQTVMGTNMMTLMSLGRGAQVAGEMAVTSVRGDLQFCRILTDFSSQELVHYLWTLNDWQKHSRRFRENGSSVEKGKVTSIQGQCAQFVTELQQGYPGTVSTLTKIGEKLRPQGEGEQEDGMSQRICGLCKRYNDGSSLDVTEGNADFELASVICYGCKKFFAEITNESAQKQLMQLTGR